LKLGISLYVTTCTTTYIINTLECGRYQVYVSDGSQHILHSHLA